MFAMAGKETDRNESYPGIDRIQSGVHLRDLFRSKKSKCQHPVLDCNGSDVWPIGAPICFLRQASQMSWLVIVTK